VEGIKGDARAENIQSGYKLPSQDVTVGCLSMFGHGAIANVNQLGLCERKLGKDTTALDVSANRNNAAICYYLLLLCS